MRAFGFLSFGHYVNAQGSQARTASDMLKQAVDIGVGADELGVNGAYFRVHHFARQQASPMPLLATIAAKTKHIEVGTGVIDMRYETRYIWLKKLLLSIFSQTDVLHWGSVAAHRKQWCAVTKPLAIPVQLIRAALILHAPNSICSCVQLTANDWHRANAARPAVR